MLGGKMAMIAAISLALCAGPGSFGVNVHAAGGGHLAETGDDERVAGAYKKLIDLRPDQAISALLAPLTEALRKGDLKRASRYMTLIAWGFKLDDNDQTSLLCAQQAELMDPDNLSATILVIEALIHWNKLEEADEKLEKIEPLAKTNALAARTMAFRWLAESRAMKAAEYLETALKLDPTDSRARYLYARIFLDETSLGQYRTAAEHTESPYMREILLWEEEMVRDPKTATSTHLEAAGKLLPDDPLWHTKLALHLTRKNQMDEAYKHALAATQCKRLSTKAHSLYASYATFRNNRENALRCLQHIQKLQPSSPEAEWVLGNFYQNNKEYAEAESAYRRAISLNAKYSPAYESMRQLPAIKDNSQRKAELIQEWTKNCPRSMHAWRFKGNVLRKSKQYQKAIEAYTEAIKWLPRARKNDTSTKVTKCDLIAGLGTSYYKLDKKTEALAQAKLFNETKPVQTDGLQIRPSKIEFDKLKTEKLIKAAEHGALADMLFESHELDDCVAEYKAALDLDKDNIVWHRGLFKAYLDKKDWVNAAKEDMVVSNDVVTNQLPKALDGWKKSVFK